MFNIKDLLKENRELDKSLSKKIKLYNKIFDKILKNKISIKMLNDKIPKNLNSLKYILKGGSELDKYASLYDVNNAFANFSVTVRDEMEEIIKLQKIMKEPSRPDLIKKITDMKYEIDNMEYKMSLFDKYTPKFKFVTDIDDLSELNYNKKSVPEITPLPSFIPYVLFFIYKDGFVHFPSEKLTDLDENKYGVSVSKSEQFIKITDNTSTESAYLLIPSTNDRPITKGFFNEPIRSIDDQGNLTPKSFNNIDESPLSNIKIYKSKSNFYFLYLNNILKRWTYLKKKIYNTFEDINGLDQSGYLSLQNENLIKQKYIQSFKFNYSKEFSKLREPIQDYEFASKYLKQFWKVLEPTPDGSTAPYNNNWKNITDLMNNIIEILFKDRKNPEFKNFTKETLELLLDKILEIYNYLIKPLSNPNNDFIYRNVGEIEILKKHVEFYKDEISDTRLNSNFENIRDKTILILCNFFLNLINKINSLFIIDFNQFNYYEDRISKKKKILEQINEINHSQFEEKLENIYIPDSAFQKIEDDAEFEKNLNDCYVGNEINLLQEQQDIDFDDIQENPFSQRILGGSMTLDEILKEPHIIKGIDNLRIISSKAECAKEVVEGFKKEIDYNLNQLNENFKNQNNMDVHFFTCDLLKHSMDHLDEIIIKYKAYYKNNLVNIYIFPIDKVSTYNSTDNIYDGMAVILSDYELFDEFERIRNIQITSDKYFTHDYLYSRFTEKYNEFYDNYNIISEYRNNLFDKINNLKFRALDHPAYKDNYYGKKIKKLEDYPRPFKVVPYNKNSLITPKTKKSLFFEKRKTSNGEEWVITNKPYISIIHNVLCFPIETSEDLIIDSRYYKKNKLMLIGKLEGKSNFLTICELKPNSIENVKVDDKTKIRCVVFTRIFTQEFISNYNFSNSKHKIKKNDVIKNTLYEYNQGVTNLSNPNDAPNRENVAERKNFETLHNYFENLDNYFQKGSLNIINDTFYDHFTLVGSQTTHLNTIFSQLKISNEHIPESGYFWKNVFKLSLINKNNLTLNLPFLESNKKYYPTKEDKFVKHIRKFSGSNSKYYDNNLNLNTNPYSFYDSSLLSAFSNTESKVKILSKNSGNYTGIICDYVREMSLGKYFNDIDLFYEVLVKLMDNDTLSKTSDPIKINSKFNDIYYSFDQSIPFKEIRKKNFYDSNSGIHWEISLIMYLPLGAINYFTKKKNNENLKIDSDISTTNRINFPPFNDVSYFEKLGVPINNHGNYFLNLEDYLIFINNNSNNVKFVQIYQDRNNPDNTAYEHINLLKDDGILAIFEVNFKKYTNIDLKYSPWSNNNYNIKSEDIVFEINKSITSNDVNFLLRSSTLS